jgi:hypothetical protein
VCDASRNKATAQRNDEGGTMNDEEKHSSELMLSFIVHRSAFIIFFSCPDPFAPLAVTTDGSKFAKTETSTSGFA